MRQAAASASSATPVECSRSHGDLRPVIAAMAANAASIRSPAIQISGDGSLSSACSHIRASSSSARSSSKFSHGELGERGLVRGARTALDDAARLVGARGGEEERDVSAPRAGGASAAGSPRRRRPGIPRPSQRAKTYSSAVLDARRRGRASRANRCATSHIVANASRALGPALAIAVLDQLGAHLRGAAEPRRWTW